MMIDRAALAITRIGPGRPSVPAQEENLANAADIVWDRAVNAPEGDALVGARGTWSSGVLGQRSAAVTGHLTRAGIAPGDRVLLVAPSVPEFAAAYYGILAAGAVAVTANTMSTRRELEYFADDAGVSLTLAWHDAGDASRQAASTLGLPHWVLEDDLGGLTGGDPAGDPATVAPDRTAVILYTSGTTGRPKGAEVTHGNLVACATAFTEVMQLSANDRFGTALPLFHVFGQAVVMGTVMRSGGSLSLLERFEVGALLDMLRRDRLTAMAGVPTMWNALLRSGGLARPGDFDDLRLAVSGGASLPTEVLRAFEERFGCIILEGYGLSETTGAATFNGLDRPRKPACVGIALPGGEVQIRLDDDSEAPVDEVGEVCYRGPSVMKGYWRRPEATAEALRGGWLRTGDLGTKDADGDVRIVGRKKELIIRGGYNVYPSEVEEVLYQHPDIVEAAVVGVPDDHLGEEVAAVVAVREGAHLELEPLRAWAKRSLSAYKVPHLLQVVDALPKGPTGKILKREIDVAAVRGTDVAPTGQGVA